MSMHNNPLINSPEWEKKINDPYLFPIEEIERVKQLDRDSYLTHSYDEWNYHQSMANNTFSIKAAFDSVIEILESSYYHDMIENDLISDFYYHRGSVQGLIATNMDPAEVDYVGGGEMDRIPLSYLESSPRGRLPVVNDTTLNRTVATNPITHRAQPDVFHDYQGKYLATKLGVTWFKYVWTWDDILPMNREIFERTKLLNRWLDKNTFCRYHDIFQHSILVYVNGLPVNDFSVMLTRTSNMLMLPFDNRIYMDIQKGSEIDLRIMRIASRKHYWGTLNYTTLMTRYGGILDIENWTDYADVFDDMNSDLIILNMAEKKSNRNLAYRDKQKTEMLTGIETVFLHLHKREDGSNYIDLNEMNPVVLEWWKNVVEVTCDIIRPKNMVEYTADGGYPYLVGKKKFPDDADSSTSSFDTLYDVIDLTGALKKDDRELGVSEEDIICFKQVDERGGFCPVDMGIVRSYPNTFRIDGVKGINEDVEIHPYSRFYDVLNEVNDSLANTQVDISAEASEDKYPAVRVFYFTKTLYRDTELDPILLAALKTARRYLFNPYRYDPPIMGNLKVGTEFTIRENGNQEAPYLVLRKDYPIPGKVLCIRKHALPTKRNVDGVEVDTVQNDYLDIYQDQFTTAVEYEEWENGDRSHLWGRFSPNALRFMEKCDVPYRTADGEIGYFHLRFFDPTEEELSSLDDRICLTEDGTPVPYRLRDQSSAVLTYQQGLPAYQYIDENGIAKEDMPHNGALYLRPCILIDDGYDFIRWNKLIDGIHISLPDYLTPYPLTHWSDHELLRVILANKQYFLKYIRALFPDENDYRVEKFYKYSDENMANMMDIVTNVPEYDNMHDGIEGNAFGQKNTVQDMATTDLRDSRKWIVTRATIAYIPEKIKDVYAPENYTINSHVMTENGIELVVNMARYNDPSPTQYRKILTITSGGTGYMVHDRIYLRQSQDVEMMVQVVSVDRNGSVREIDIPSWADTHAWNLPVVVVGGHGTGFMVSVENIVIESKEYYQYYPYIGMELHIEHPTVYDYDPAGRFLTTTLISGTGEGLLANIESENIQYDPARDREMWNYAFDYLTLKMRNFIDLYPDNFMTYLEKQFRAPYQDWKIRVFKDTDISEYKRYHSGNVFVYTSYLSEDSRDTEFTMLPGYHAKLRDIRVYREYDVYHESSASNVHGRELISHPDDSGDLFAVIDGERIWQVSVYEDGEWVEVNDPEQEVFTRLRLHHVPDHVYQDDQVVVDFCSVHWEFISIRDTLVGELWQQPTVFEKFEHPQFLVRFNNEPNDEITYLPFVGGFEKPFIPRVHIEHDDYIYLDWGMIYSLKNSTLVKKAESHQYYRVKQFKIVDPVVEGFHLHVGQELHLECITPGSECFKQVTMLAIVDSFNEGNLLSVHIHDHQRVFKDYDPTGTWSVIVTDAQRADDKFHIGVGEQNSEDDWDRINWFNQPENRESNHTPKIEVIGELIKTEEIPEEIYHVEVNNTYTIRKMFNYYWEQEFSLPHTDENWGEGAILHPAENHFNELHLEDLKIVDQTTGEVVPYDIADGQEVFTLTDIIPEISKSVRIATRYNLKQLRIRDYNLNLRQTLYRIQEITPHKLRFVSDIRRMADVSAVYIDPSAVVIKDEGIAITEIEPGDCQYAIGDYPFEGQEHVVSSSFYVPENEFRSWYQIPPEMVFDHQDYTIRDVTLYDQLGNAVLIVDMDIRHTTLPFTYNGTNLTINNRSVPVLNNPAPIGPMSEEWKANYQYLPSTDQYVQKYLNISPFNIEGIEWKPDVIPYPFELAEYETIAVGSDSHAVENNFIRIKHVYNVRSLTDAIDRRKIWASPSSKTNNDDPNDQSFSYLDPPIPIHLQAKMKEYPGLKFIYSEGVKWKYDPVSQRYMPTGETFTYLPERVINIGYNQLDITLKGTYETKGKLHVYVTRANEPIPDEYAHIPFKRQDAFQQLRPPFDYQNYMQTIGNMPYQENHGRGQYVVFGALSTYYEPTNTNLSLDPHNSSTNIFTGNFGYPYFHFPEQEIPVYRGNYVLDDMTQLMVSEDSYDNYYPRYDKNYVQKIHEDTMRNSGYYDTDYTPYQSQFVIYTYLEPMSVQDDSLQLKFVEPYLTIGELNYHWDYEPEHTKGREKEFTIHCFTELDQLRNNVHFERVNHGTIHLTLWQSEDDREGFTHFVDEETNLRYGVKFEVEQSDRQYVPFTKFSDRRWKFDQVGEEDSWLKHIRIPFKIPYSVHGKLLTVNGLDDEDRELHRGNYWIYITPRLYFMGSLFASGTKEQIESIEDPIDGIKCVVTTPEDGIYYQGTYQVDHWVYTPFIPEENASYSVVHYNGTNVSTSIAYLGEEFVECDDLPVDKFSPEGDKFELYEETRLYNIYTAYERGIVQHLEVYDNPTVRTYDLSYLYQSEHYQFLIDAICDEFENIVIPYFYLGYQKFYAQIVNTLKEEIMWIPVWTYIGSGDPPFDEDDPHREWHYISEQYRDLNGAIHNVRVAYHKEDFPVDIDQKIKDGYHTYFEHSRDIYYKCRVSERKIKQHELSVYVLPRNSVYELPCGFKYTDIQYQFRVKGKPGRYKAIIDMIPKDTLDPNIGERPFSSAFFPAITTEDRITIRATRVDGSTYNVPLLSVPNMRKPLITIQQASHGTLLEFHRYCPKDTAYFYQHNTYPMNPVFNARMIAPDAMLDLNYPYLKKVWFRSQFDSQRYQIYSNGRLLTEGDQYHLITPTKIIFHGLTSLHNLEILEVNREPHKEFFQPTGDMRNRLDAILAGYHVDHTYQNEFTYEEQANFIQEGVVPQIASDHDLFDLYPYNFDTDPDILEIPDDAQLEDDYQWMTDIPYMEGAPLYSNIQFDDYSPYISAGMDQFAITNQEITEMMRVSMVEKYDDHRYDIDSVQLKDQINIIWNSYCQGDDWKAVFVPFQTYPYGYLKDVRYRDHFPQFDKVFGAMKDRLYHDPTQPEYPMLHERDWIRYWCYLPNIPYRDRMRIMWDRRYQDHEWTLDLYDPQIIHGSRFNWKGQHKPTSIEDISYYTIWKINSKQDPDHPWWNQHHRSYTEPDRVYVEQDKNNYFGYLGDYIQPHYYQLNIPNIGKFVGFNGWYPWNNPELNSPQIYWDTGRFFSRTTGQAPYSDQIDNDQSRINPEIFQYQILEGNQVMIYLDHTYEGDWSVDHLQGVNPVHLSVVDLTTSQVIHDLFMPVNNAQPTTFLLSDIRPGHIYDIHVDMANRRGIREGKHLKVDRS